MSTYQRWCHLKGVLGELGECGWEEKSPHIGPYLPIMIVNAPSVYWKVWYGVAHWRDGVVLLC